MKNADAARRNNGFEVYKDMLEEKITWQIAHFSNEIKVALKSFNGNDIRGCKTS